MTPFVGLEMFRELGVFQMARFPSVVRNDKVSRLCSIVEPHLTLV